MAILTAWRELQESLCSKCGRPLALHAEQAPDDFHADWRECPAVIALDHAQATKSVVDQQAREAAEKSGNQVAARLQPERSRTWLTWTDAEGEPEY